jgi:hypothetical protein
MRGQLRAFSSSNGATLAPMPTPLTPPPLERVLQEIRCGIVLSSTAIHSPPIEGFFLR